MAGRATPPGASWDHQLTADNHDPAFAWRFDDQGPAPRGDSHLANAQVFSAAKNIAVNDVDSQFVAVIR